MAIERLLYATLAQIWLIGFDGQIELEALRLNALPEDAPAIPHYCCIGDCTDTQTVLHAPPP